jgi:hypothetical protein
MRRGFFHARFGSDDCAVFNIVELKFPEKIFFYQ